MKNKYLYSRNNCWYLRLRLPKRLGRKIIRKSLHTNDEKLARKFRDKYIMPIIHANNNVEALEMLKFSLSQNLNEAEKIHASINELVTECQNIFLYDAIDQYLEYLPNAGLREASVNDYTSTMRFLKKNSTDKSLNAISKNDAIELLNIMLKKKLSPTTIKFKFSTIKSFMRWCINRDYAAEMVLKAFDIQLPKVVKNPTPPIPAESAELAINIMKNWTLVPRIARYTGMRLREILRLTENDIIIEHGIKCIYVSNKAKNKTARIVPISEKLLPYINDLSELNTKGKPFDKWNIEIKKLKNCEKCKFHSWRSYAITQMMKAGIDPAVRKRVTGHKISKDDIHEIYTSVELSDMKKAVDCIP
ncbi:tyrosine-type recombinase/integrase [Lentisphaerota bacterium WC36G]|nr:tyrosine-type recombinase/integrase [Lentisphaerae bacterium WC36]